MIERKFVAEKVKEYLVSEYLHQQLGAGRFSHFEIRRTPLGERVVIYTARPGYIVGKGGENIKELTRVMKMRFKMENPQVEVSEITRPNLDAQTMAEQIVTTLERFGPKRFKSMGYRTLQQIIDAGALGAEIIISGRGLPGSRAKSWRFYSGHLKKSGDVAMSKVLHAKAKANLKSGTIGVKVSILPRETVLPDRITLKELPPVIVQEETVISEEKLGPPEEAPSEGAEPVQKLKKRRVSTKKKKSAGTKPAKEEVVGENATKVS